MTATEKHEMIESFIRQFYLKSDKQTRSIIKEETE